MRLNGDPTLGPGRDDKFMRSRSHTSRGLRHTSIVPRLNTWKEVVTSHPDFKQSGQGAPGGQAQRFDLNMVGKPGRGPRLSWNDGERAAVAQSSAGAGGRLGARSG